VNFFAVLAAGTLVTVFVGLMVVALSRSIKQTREAWIRTAAEHGLEFKPGGFLKGMKLRGQVQGVGLQVRTISRSAGQVQVTYTVVEAKVPVALPIALTVTREGPGARLVKAFGGQDIDLQDAALDARLRVQGARPAAIQALLNHEQGRTGLVALLHGNGNTKLAQDTVTIEITGLATDKLDGAIRAAISSARCLSVAAQAPWRQLAERHGLAHREQGLQATLSGRMAGVPVAVRASGALAEAHTEIWAEVVGGLPPGVVLEAGDGGGRFGDPILDGRIAVTGPGADAALAYLRERVQDPRSELRGCLMDVLQGIPGAQIRDGAVHVSVAGRLGEGLPGLLERVAVLAAALSDAAETPDPQDERLRQAADRRLRQ
jgi:hypothetical protein